MDTPHRLTLASAIDDRLYFAQVREDPRLELEAMALSPDDSVVVVSSGGCTALSLLAAGARHVAAVDMNRAQNHLVELKLAAVTALPAGDALAFLGARAAPRTARRRVFAELRPALGAAARAYWDMHPKLVERGVLDAGVTEAFISTVVRVLRSAVVGRAAIDRLLACAHTGEQQALFARDWSGWRWRMLFRALLGPASFRRTYDPAFFAHLERPSFDMHFRSRAEYTLTRLPVRDNYFLHHMLAGAYGAAEHGCLPPYLDGVARERLRHSQGALTLVDASMTDYLRTRPDGSVNVFVLSNICEWLPAAGIDALFAEVVRTAAPGARVCFRNFVGWTEVPERWRSSIVEDRARGEALMAGDRSVVQRRFAPCTVRARHVA